MLQVLLLEKDAAGISEEEEAKTSLFLICREGIMVAKRNRVPLQIENRGRREKERLWQKTRTKTFRDRSFIRFLSGTIRKRGHFFP
jgi:hypothetical protein